MPDVRSPAATSRRVETRSDAAAAALVNGGANTRVVEYRQTTDVCDALKLGGATWQRKRCFPYRLAAFEFDGNQLSARKPRIDGTATNKYPSSTTQCQRWRYALIDPATFSIKGIQRNDPAVGSAHQHNICQHRGRCENFPTYGAFPKRTPDTVKGQDLPFGRADHNFGVTVTDPTGELLSRIYARFDTAGTVTDADNAAICASRIYHALH